MNADQEAKQLQLLRAIADTVNDLESSNHKLSAEILTHLTRINSMLSAIDRNLTLLEMKK